MAYLILIRHGESEWNAKGIWTGWKDISLTEKGKEEARKAGAVLKDIKIDVAFTSKLIRTKQTLNEIKKILNLENIKVIEDEALNERDYGDYTGKNKWEIKEKIGKEEFIKIRRDWDYPIPKGESLKDVYNRTVPYFIKKILPILMSGKNVLVSAHGNSIRALAKYIDNISDENISKLEIATGEVYIYTIDEEGNIVYKEIRK